MAEGIYIEPDHSIQMPEEMPGPMEMAERFSRAQATVDLLRVEGLPIKPTDRNKLEAAALTKAYAQDGERTSELVTDRRFAAMAPAAVEAVNEVLSNFGMLIAKRSEEIRNVVVNQLLILADDDDKRIRIRALEDLGKIGEVGLFTDRKDIHITNHSKDEVQEQLREKLIELKKQADGSYAPAKVAPLPADAPNPVAEVIQEVLGD